MVLVGDDVYIIPIVFDSSFAFYKEIVLDSVTEHFAKDPMAMKILKVPTLVKVPIYWGPTLLVVKSVQLAWKSVVVKGPWMVKEMV